MRQIGLALVGAALLGTTAARAEPPAVATDIPPVHSLVARVMQGVGEPSRILPPNASPHGYAMRPSEAALLDRAEVVFWVGPELTPWLERAIGTLGSDATSVALIDAPGTMRLDFREGATFEAHHHDDEDGHDHDEDHEAHDHDDGEAHDHADEHDHAHEHHGIDPHAWLDPENAKVWLDRIAETLAQADPDDAATYRKNAEAGKAEIDIAAAEVTAELAPVRDKPFIVFHDAYHYFENRFGLEAAGAVSLSDASKPGPARVQEIRDTIRSLDATCVFVEPQFNTSLIAILIEGTDARQGTLDPLGVDLTPGPALYPNLLQELAGDMVACLK
ncbi:zinc ABC transporter substrate-binding protein [Amorphus sp. 3PC139-8]|uniref:zinc ABC transporter substrate-binding protein n=1 Tax=Amorphus sp. 3PC139-8 TaxID=2735676 RepID=UPI00345D3294